MEEVLADGANWPGAVAVSGGGDSVALLLLLRDWALNAGRPPPVMLTVDHGLKRNSAEEAAKIAARAQAWRLEAHVLRWRGSKPSGDIEAAARGARYRLMGDWCSGHGIDCLYVAHTIDDQAETFLLRLMRGSGVDGLSAMTGVARYPSPGCERLRVARPVLGIRRARLRNFLAHRAEAWSEDEMNSDPRFARVRLRAAWPLVESLGLTTERMADAARHLARARAALDSDMESLLARASCVAEDGRIFADGALIAAAPAEIGLRALACLLMQASGRAYRPRFERLERLYDALCDNALGGGRTLLGCSIRPAPKCEMKFGPRTIRIAREVKGRTNARKRAGVPQNPENRPR